MSNTLKKIRESRNVRIAGAALSMGMLTGILAGCSSGEKTPVTPEVTASAPVEATPSPEPTTSPVAQETSESIPSSIESILNSDFPAPQEPVDEALIERMMAIDHGKARFVRTLNDALNGDVNALSENGYTTDDLKLIYFALYNFYPKGKEYYETYKDTTSYTLEAEGVYYVPRLLMTFMYKLQEEGRLPNQEAQDITKSDIINVAIPPLTGVVPQTVQQANHVGIFSAEDLRNRHAKFGVFVEQQLQYPDPNSPDIKAYNELLEEYADIVLPLLEYQLQNNA